ncbi:MULTISPECIES: winged helix-turn-helix domain-containing protein [unclassified Variovorax]|uniref:winged helix-turn-helix domain-containing protein n=1 Tax=unclassified Variovorax TaxID=663243 RepID=UPI0034E84F72
MDILKFPGFEIHTARRQVRINGESVPLGARAFDLLMLLVEQRERIVTKAEIFALIWPGQVVEDNNLTVQVSALRKSLGSETIATVTGRGYRFVGQPEQDCTSVPRHAVGNLPLRTLPVYGRERELADLSRAHETQPCVTVCGLAGVGKTTLAILAARQMAAARHYAHGVWQVELATVLDPERLVQAVCGAIGLQVNPREVPLAQCLAQLRHRELLLLLDNCEHLADEVASFVDTLIQDAPKVHVLATSHEPLRLPGERIIRLNPLEVPPTPDVRDAIDYGAVRMLLERVRAAMGGSFEPTAQDLVDLVEICRQLDGVPLALEFAAARVPVLGLGGVRSRLYDRLRLFSRGPRTAPSRHSSLQAALEWSHQLLPPAAQQLLHQLAIFPGGFSLQGAELLVGPERSADLIEHLDILVERSLITRQPGSRPRYRMLETTRAFALDALQASIDGIDWNSRLAHAMAQLCMDAARDRDSMLMWEEVPNVRAALTWTLTAPGHEQVAITIATFISVGLGAAGATGEALEHLKRVQPLVDARCPTMLAARFWHWYGRVGSEGRMPVSLSVEAMSKADALFESLGERRHRHSCQRHLAEVELEAGHPERAEMHLRIALELEQGGVPEVDWMRRLRVESRLADARGQFDLALRHAQAALELAEALGVKRYRLLLRADMAWTQLQMGRADAAVEGGLELLQYLDDSIRQGQARGRVLSGLTAALVAAGQIERSMRSAADSLTALRQANLLRSRSEVFAWVAAAAGFVHEAAQLIGAGETFFDQSENERDPISKMAQRRALELIDATVGNAELQYWRAQGRGLGDAGLDHLLTRTFATPSQARDD